MLVPALVTAALLDAWLARSWGRLRRQLPAAVGLAVLLAGWAVWRLATGKGALGGYDVVASTSYSVGAAARFVLYHGASLLILCGLFPLAAVAVKLVEGLRRGEQDERVRAYLAVTASLCVWVVVEVGAFASRYSDRIVERNLIGLAPLLFIGLVLWLARGPDGGYVVRGAVAAGALAVLLLLPVRPLRRHLRDARRADADPDVQALDVDVALDAWPGSTGRWRWRRRPCSCSYHGAGCSGFRSR